MCEVDFYLLLCYIAGTMTSIKTWWNKDTIPLWEWLIRAPILLCELVLLAAAIGVAVVTFPIWGWMLFVWDTVAPGYAHIRNPAYERDPRFRMRYLHNQSYWGCSCGYDGEWIYPSQCNELARRVRAGQGPPW